MAKSSKKSVAVESKKAPVAMHWNSVEEFAAAIDAAGVRPDTGNVQAEYNLYESDKNGYKDHMNLRQQG